jgi:hypothetical protein
VTLLKKTIGFDLIVSNYRYIFIKMKKTAQEMKIENGVWGGGQGGL